MKTYSAKLSELKSNWWVIDANELILGRLASHVANLLRGKHKPTFTPSMDCGDHVIIVNAEKIHLTGTLVLLAGLKKLTRKSSWLASIHKNWLSARLSV